MRLFERFKIKDVLIPLVIVAITLLYYLDKYIPENLISFNLFGLTIGSFGFPDINHLVYHTKMKVLIICLAIIWYFTCKHWWRSAILVIITIEFFKLISALNYNNIKIDEIDYLTSLPITIPIILLLIFLSNKLSSYNLTEELRTQIDSEIDGLFFEFENLNTEELRTLKRNFQQINKSKASKNPKDYLKDLIALRDEFYQTEDEQVI